MSVGQYLVSGYPGMKSTSQEDDVVSLPSKVSIPPGRIVHKDTDGTAILPTAGSVAGLALADAVYNYVHVTGQFPVGAAVSVMARGRAFAKVTASGAVTDGAPVHYAADGTVANAGNFTLANSKFVGGIQTTAEGEQFAEIWIGSALSSTSAT